MVENESALAACQCNATTIDGSPMMSPPEANETEEKKLEGGEPKDGQQAAASQASGQFAIQQVYIKDVSFEAPGLPATPGREWRPDVELQLSSSSTSPQADTYEVVLRITATAKVEEQVAFLIEVQQAGMFTVSGIEGETLGVVLGATCPNILFPYARALISDLISRGGFPALLLAPVDMHAIYHDRKRRKEASAEAAG